MAICTPPVVRHHLAAAAIAYGLHVLLEKPPAATMSQADNLAAQARQARVTAFAAWLSDRMIQAVAIVWREDIQRWQPGQKWTFKRDNLGVLDPGINALSVLIAILPAPVMLKAATLDVPAGRSAPIAAALAMGPGTAQMTAPVDFLQAGTQT